MKKKRKENNHNFLVKMNSKETFPQPYFVAHQCLKRTILYFFVLLVVVGYICYDDDAAQEIIKPANETSKAVSCD